jgi:DNA mismatch endonuclease (patch repair protein)
MSRIKSKDTAPEIALRKKLWADGLRYRKDFKPLPGRPDIVFTRAKVIVFIDGAFWHGKKLSLERLLKMPPYWQQKIQKNVDRDKRNTHLLEDMGYTVMRFTDVQIAKNLDDVVNRIKSQVYKFQHRHT